MKKREFLSLLKTCMIKDKKGKRLDEDLIMAIPKDKRVEMVNALMTRDHPVITSLTAGFSAEEKEHMYCMGYMYPFDGERFKFIGSSWNYIQHEYGAGK